MKPILLSIVLAFALNQAPQEDYPGQSQHAKPPNDWFCSHDATDGAHKCSCHRVMQQCDLEPAAPDCKAYCFEKNTWVDDGNGRGHMEPTHCHCPIQPDPLCGIHKKP